MNGLDDNISHICIAITITVTSFHESGAKSTILRVS